MEEFSFKYTIENAENLPKTDLLGTTDPYIIIKLRKSSTLGRTTTFQKEQNPRYE